MRGMSSRFFLLGLFLLTVLPFFSAETMLSEANVSYDSELVRVFEDEAYARSIAENDDLIGVEILEDTTFARVGVVLKDNSGIEIVGSKSERRDLVERKVEWIEKNTQALVSTLSSKHVKEINTNSAGFSALVSEKGFEELVNDSRVQAITWSSDKAELTGFDFRQSISLFLLALVLIVILVVMLLLILFLKKGRGKKKILQ